MTLNEPGKLGRGSPIPGNRGVGKLFATAAVVLREIKSW